MTASTRSGDCARSPGTGGGSRRWGPSYLGHTQWALVDAAADELAAMALIVSSSRFVRCSSAAPWRPSSGWHGAPSSSRSARSATASVGSCGYVPSEPAGSPTRCGTCRWATPTAWTRRTLPWWQTWLAHHEPDDEYWRQFDHSRNVSKVTAPVLMVTGWYDRFLPWQLADWDALDHQGDAQRLIIGPWKHDPWPVPVSGVATQGDRQYANERSPREVIYLPVRRFPPAW